MKLNPLKNLSGWSVGTTELVNLLVYATNDENDIKPSRSFPTLNVKLHLNAARLGHLPRFSSVAKCWRRDARRGGGREASTPALLLAIAC